MNSKGATDSEDTHIEERVRSADPSNSVCVIFDSDMISLRKASRFLVFLVCLCIVVSAITTPSAAQSVTGNQSQSLSSVDIPTETLQRQLGKSTLGPAKVEDGFAQMGNRSNNTSEGTSSGNTDRGTNGNNTSTSSSGNNTSNAGNQSNGEGSWGRMANSYKQGVGNRIDALSALAGGNVSNAQRNWNASNRNFSQAGNSARAGLNQTKNDAINATENVLPSGFDISLSIATGWFTRFENQAKSMIDDFGWMLVSLPAPGDAFKIETWYPGFVNPVNSSMVNNTSNYTTAGNISSMGSVDGRTRAILPGWINLNDWWGAAWKLYAGLSALVTAPLLVLAIFTWAEPGRARERNKRLRDIGIAFLLVILGVVLMPFILHASNIAATGAIPGGDALLRTPGNIAKLGLGALFINLLTIAVSLIFGYIQWLVTFFVAALWPLYAALWASSSQTLKGYSKLGFSLLGFLIGLKFLQALWLRFLYLLPLDITDPVTSVFTLVTIIIGLFIGFIAIPMYAAIKVVPSFVVNLIKAPAETGTKLLLYK